MKNINYKNLLNKITNITSNSTKVENNSAFIAIEGYKDDGHKYIPEALKKGAKVIICEKKPDVKTNDAKIVQVNNSRKVLGKLAAKFYNNPSHNLELIGITGTNGKTTTAHLIYNMLNWEEKTSGIIGTVKVDTGKKINEGGLTTPPPVTMQNHLAKMVKNNLKYCCMEVSSHGIKLHRITDIQYNVKIGTNITKDHYDFHPTFKDYKNVKKSFLQTKENNALVLLNNDNLHLRKFGQIANNQYNFGITFNSDIEAKNIRKNGIETTYDFTLNKPLNCRNNNTIKPFSFPLKLYLPGKHNIYNSLITTTIGLYYGLCPENINGFFKEFSGIWRRFEIIYKDNFTIIDDCAHNPGSYQAVFNTLHDISFNKLIIVNSLRGNRGIKINKQNARIITNNINSYDNYHLIITASKEEAKKINMPNDEERENFLQILNQKNINYTYFENLKPSLEKALDIVDRDDLILLLGPHPMDNAGKKILNYIDNNTVSQ